MKILSVIVPCYNEEENVSDFYDELKKLILRSYILMTDLKIIQH